MKTFAILFFSVLCPGANAQKGSDTLTKGNTFIRFNITKLLDVSEPNISFGVEKRLFERFSFAMDGGYIFYSERFHSSGRSSGFIIRPAIRYFPNSSRFFVEAEFHFKQHTHHINDWIGHDVVQGVPAYEELTEFKLRKQVAGTHLKIGTLIPVSKRLWFEFYIGAGVHFRKYKVAGHPDVIYRFNQEFINVTTGENVRLIAIPAGFRILYRLR